MGITREGGSAPGLWEALWVQPSRGFDTRCARRGGWGIARSSVRRGAQAWWWRFGFVYTAHHGTFGEDRRWGGGGAVSYTHLTLPTNREV